MRKLFVSFVVLLLVSSSGIRNSNAQENQRDRSRGEESSGSENSSQSWSDWWSDDEASGDEQTRAKSRAQAFIRRHDTDENDKLSRGELPSRMRSDFDRLDRNQDGSVTQQEVEQFANQSTRSQRRRLSSTPAEVTYVWILDANRGEVELKELQAAYSALRKIDKDNDGKVTREELLARREQVASQWCDKCFDRLDGDHDSELSKDEAQDSTFADQFARIDQNDDQSLTKSEIHRYLDQQFKASQSQDQSRQAQRDRRSGDSSDDDSDSDAQSASRDSGKRR